MPLLVFGRRRALGGSACAEATLDFSLNVTAQSFGNDAGSSELAEVGNGELGQIGKNCCQRRGRLAQQRDANVIRNGPFAVTNDGGNNGRWELFARKSFQDLRFGQIGIVEHRRDDLWMPLGQQRAGNAGGTTARERDFLAQGNLSEAREQLLFGVAFQLGGDGGRKRKLNEIH